MVPAHNSEKEIGKAIQKYNDVFSEKFRDFEIIVVCNDCHDNTENICKALQSTLPIKIINIPERGKGYALNKGFSESKFDIMGFLDADNPFELDKILKMLEYLRDYDTVIVSKYLKSSKKKQESLLRRLVSLGGNIFSRIFLGLKYRDTQAGAKFFNKNVWDKIGGNFICSGFDWDMEFLYRLKKSNYRVAEVYMPARYGKFSTVRLKHLPGMIIRLLIVRFL